MKAIIGDKIVVKGHRVGDPSLQAEVLAIKGENGEPPYLVRWASDGHEGLLFPGLDAVVEHTSFRGQQES